MLKRLAVGAWVVAGLIALLGSESAVAAGPYKTSVIDAPAGSLTVACGIDVRGNIVGYYTDRTGTHGFFLNDGSFSTITFPGARWTAAYGVNAAGQIVGAYGSDEFSSHHGFLRSGGQFSSIDYPGAGDTVARGVNNRGQIVGDYMAADGSRHAFLLSGGAYQPIEFPEVAGGSASGINDGGQIVGVMGSGNTAKGFTGNASGYSSGSVSELKLYGSFWSQ